MIPLYSKGKGKNKEGSVMFLESFRHIIEREALKKQNNDNLRRISSENKRISDLVERRKKTEISLENLKNEIADLKLEETQALIENFQSRLNKLKAQSNSAITEKEQIAFESQIESVSKELESAEEKYFNNLEKSEELTEEREQLKEFLHGSVETLKIISDEVALQIAKEEKEIQGRTQRMNSLIDLLHPSVRSLYQQCENNKARLPTIAFLMDRKCSECHIQVDSTLKSSLDQGASIETCPNCGRFLIPETAKIYS